MDNSSFRQNYPEFADTTKYPDAMLTYWTTVADIYVDTAKWDTLSDIGLSLALAHFLVLASGNQSLPGSGAGLVNSQAAGPVSVGFDTQATTEERGGNWNLTVYGTQFLRMARLIGGAAQL